VCAVTTPPHSPYELDGQTLPSQTGCGYWKVCRINCLLFKDDLVLLATSDQGLQHELDQFSGGCDQAGMEMNAKSENTKVNPIQRTLQVQHVRCSMWGS